MVTNVSTSMSVSPKINVLPMPLVKKLVVFKFVLVILVSGKGFNCDNVDECNGDNTCRVKLLVLTPRVAITAPALMDSLEPVINVLTAMNVVMVPNHVLKILHVRIMLVHTHANDRMVMMVAGLNLQISMSVNCHHMMRMPQVKIP